MITDTLKATFMAAFAAMTLHLQPATAAEIYDHRGPNLDGVFPARDYITDFTLGEKLILWKTLLPAEGQNTPIVVGDKVFLLCSNGLESDCPELFCLNIQDGTVLWRKPVDNLDALPPEVQKEAKALRHEELRLSHAGRDLAYRFNQVITVGKPVTVTDQAAFDRVVAEARELGVLSEKGYADFMQSGHPDNFPISATHLDLNYHSRHPVTTDAQRARANNAKKLAENDWFKYEGWYYLYDCYNGRTMPSPMSDGEQVYVFTQDGTVACFDLKGERKWLVCAMVVPPGNNGLVTASPALVGELVIAYHCSQAVALDRRTGEVRWRYATQIGATYSEAASPVHLILDGVDYLYLTSSEILRAHDGKRVGRLEPPSGFTGGYRGYLGSHYDSIGKRDKLWLVNTTNGGGEKRPSLFHFRLRKDGENVVGDLLSHEPSIEQPCVVLDGETLHQRVIRGIIGSYLVTDSHLIAMTAPEAAQGILVVHDKKTMAEIGRVTIPPEAPVGRILAQRIARVAQPNWKHPWGSSSPIAWGNRIIVRNNDAIYCIGMPGTTFRMPEGKR